jgi:GDPmannose 4,6-dehydratase
VRRALILGVTGQDGQFLANLLLNLNYEVLGASRNLPNWRNNPLGLLRSEHKIVDVANYLDLFRLIEAFMPDEIYNLSGESSVARSFLNPTDTASSNVIGVLNLLNAVKELGMQERVRIFQASSSDMFGPSQVQLSENSHLSPKSPYGVSKFLAHKMCLQYRNQFGLWISSGILFNHESELRPEHFVFQKVIRSLVEISQGKREFLELGNLEIYRDWGYAGDYVEAMQKSLQSDNPRDYVIATGRLNSLRNVIEKTCELLGLSGAMETYVKIDPSLMRPLDIERTWGNPKLAEELLGWKARTTFEELIEKMVRVNLRKLNEAD